MIFSTYTLSVTLRLHLFCNITLHISVNLLTLHFHTFSNVTTTLFMWYYVCTSSVMMHSHAFGDNSLHPFSDDTFAHLREWYICTLLVIKRSHLFVQDTSHLFVDDKFIFLFRHDMFAPLQAWYIHIFLERKCYTSSAMTCLHPLGEDQFTSLWLWPMSYDTFTPDDPFTPLWSWQICTL